MATASGPTPVSTPLKGMVIWRKLFFALFTVNTPGFVITALLLFLAEALLSVGIVWKVPYTEIDWGTYAQQVKCYINGERNYTRIEGDTGPIVYPAGHLMIYRWLYYWTDAGKNIPRAQYIFVGLYLLNLLLIFRLFYRSRRIAPFVLVLVCLTSYRIHSIFMLRLFNDPIAMLIFFAAVNLWLGHQWVLGCVTYSLAVSVKMNILLFSPAVFFILLLSNRFQTTFNLLLICLLVQLAIAHEFLVFAPLAYAQRAFELSRVFFFKWTVNWRFLPESLFLDRRFHLALLAAHLAVLALFAAKMWFRSQGGLIGLIKRLRYGIRTRLDAHEILYALFTANFVGMAFARSLHYQFYCWYYHSLAYLLFSSIYPTVGTSTIIDEEKLWQQPLLSIVPVRGIAVRLVVLMGIEYCWNTYPSTPFSSLLLHTLHAVILCLLLWNREQPPPIASAFKKIR